jgi:hypothetical protein
LATALVNTGRQAHLSTTCSQNTQHLSQLHSQGLATHLTHTHHHSVKWLIEQT